MFTYGSPHMTEQKQGNQLEPTCSSKDTGCSPEGQPEAINDREERREKVRDICAGGTSRWWYIYIYIYVCVCVRARVCVCM